MTRLALIADDLTGALDASAPFAARGLSTIVALGPEALPHCLAKRPDVVAVSSDSRELAPDAARRAVAACAGQLPRDLRLFKKIDSRLKGNIAAEFEALIFERALVVPAIPEFGRLVADGRLTGFGISEPVGIAARLGAAAGKSVIPDIDSQTGIEAALENEPHDLLVGARGLAEALARRLAPEAETDFHPPAASGVVFVIGSRDPITRAQVEVLKAACPGLCVIAAPDGVGPGQLPERAAVTLVEATETEGQADPAQVALGLAQLLARIGMRPGETLVVSGGATAQVILGQMGVRALELFGEALPGLPFAKAEKFNIITKSGGFGDSSTLLRLLGRLGVQ